MKKTLIIAYLLIFSLGISSVFAGKPEENETKDKPVVPEKTGSPENIENKLSEEELDVLIRRVEEIRDMDKSELSTGKKKELKKELKEIKATVKEQGGYIYISAGTLLVIILLVILLL